jgi:uncharacterized protein
MRIWDAHCHPDEPGAPGRSLAEKVELIIRTGDRLGIERFGCIFRPNGNDREILDVLSRYRRRIYGCLWMTLWDRTTQSSLALLDRWIRDGPMVGMKLAGTDGVCSLPVYDPVFAHAAKLKAGIFIHAWLQVGGDPPLAGGKPSPDGSTPQDVAILAKRYPEVPFVCLHSGGDWEPGIRAIRSASNVLAEVAGSYPTRGFVEMAVRELGANRVVYGSDCPGRSFASQLAKVHGAMIAEREKELVFSGNLRRVLGPILRAKGIPDEQEAT